MKILLTREAHLCKEGVRILDAAGFESVCLPLIETVPLAVDPDRAATVRRGLAAYDYLLFTSRNGVLHFADWLAAQGLTRPAGAEILCIGAKTSRAAENLGWEGGWVPAGAHAAEEMLTDLTRRPLVNRRVLFPKARETRDVVQRTLEARGARVDELPVYETRPRAAARAELQRLAGSAVDWIALFSPSGIRSLFHLLGEKPSREWFERCTMRIASIGRVTSGELRRRALNPSVEAAAPSVEELCARIVEWERRHV